MSEDTYTSEDYAKVYGLFHQAVCEQREEPDLDDLGFTGDVERAFALAVFEVLGMKSDLVCIDCAKEHPGLYMVTDEVWASAVLQHDDGWVCVPCLTIRLERRLVRSDFTDTPANDWIASAFEEGRGGQYLAVAVPA